MESFKLLEYVSNSDDCSEPEHSYVSDKSDNCSKLISESCPVNNSNIKQYDGNVSISDTVSSVSCHTPTNQHRHANHFCHNLTQPNLDDSSSTCSTDFDTDDELEPVGSPVNFVPQKGPDQRQNLEISDQSGQTSRLPLCLILNARSLYNKARNFKTLLYQICPDLAIISETWERQRHQLSKLIDSSKFKSISHYRQGRPGGGCAIIFNDSRFNVEELDMSVPDQVEAAWAVLTCKDNAIQKYKVNKIVVGSIYVSPKSRHKIETIDHIIETVHHARAKFGNDVHFLLGGDFNRLDVTEILDAYGALKQFISTPTRKDAILELLLTDLHPFFHPPTTLPPLQVDEDKVGSDSDHDIVVLAPKSNCKFKVERTKKTVKTRPLPDSGVDKFGKEITSHDWQEVLQTDNIDEKVNMFHKYLRDLLDKHFPEKSITISSLDKKWMSPDLKNLLRKRQREFVKHRKSNKWKKLNKKFKKLKRKTIKNFYSNFTTELKETNPSRWYEMAKKIGALDQMNGRETFVECLEGLSDKESAQLIAEHFAAISNQYSPLDNQQLPCYLPAEAPLQLSELEIYERIKKQKKTKTTLPIDIPHMLRKEFAPELTTPYANIVNECLRQQVYPHIWKYEWVTPAPKVVKPKKLSDLRKIACTSDFSKIFEGILKDYILEDISGKFDIGQYGGQQGIGTEHLLVCLVDRILYLLDRHVDKSAVIAAFVDWSAAFDRQDPTLAIKRFIEIGVRPSLIPILVSYLSGRKMKVKYNGEESDILTLIGGGPQGTLIGQLMYLVQTNSNVDHVDPADRFKYIDDLSILQVISLAGLLTDYNFHLHVASDIGIDQHFLPSSSYGVQDQLNTISQWTEDNLMKVNEKKCNFMVFSRAKVDFATRLKVNNSVIDNMNAIKLLGVWITEDLTWAKNTVEICRKAYSRVSMLTKLKYVGVSIEDLLNIYILFIRSCTEYCSVVFHSRLSGEQSASIERIQKTCLKIILNESYVSYEAALEMTGLETLHYRREQRCLDFSLKCLDHPRNSRLFPFNTAADEVNVRQKETVIVNWARTETYRMSALPYCQRLMNKHFSDDK